MKQMLKMVEEQVETGEFDALDNILDDLNRPQDLYWKEDDEGLLYVSTEERQPDNIGRLALDGGQLTVSEVDPEDIDWNGLTTRSEPESAIQDRQYD